ncbi:hypothetical protein [Pararcticibacter amylolyticus]|uniref:Uncharacterized protein n=1 Tax=Pararcticibacter amylolyticus TaxID=2173175 RepID=A0A2U2PJI6_9SPHI|nr:hypothetical protein [Pararcticibacter amylolyticus]PWG81563.1 hypothetical protein DDR33_06960 [Pararcticibacter amylolyticus]
MDILDIINNDPPFVVGVEKSGLYYDLYVVPLWDHKQARQEFIIYNQNHEIGTLYRYDCVEWRWLDEPEFNYLANLIGFEIDARNN